MNSENRTSGYRKYDIGSTLLATADYFYDPMGRRMAKSVDGALTRYLYNEEDIWMAITPGGTVIHYHHGPGIDEPLVAWASYEGSYWEPLYYFADGLGSIRAAKGQDWLGRDMSATYEFDSFGQVMSSTSTLKAEWPLFTYTAREADAETGQLFFRTRYYDPRTGRFRSEDPIRSFWRERKYRYVLNSPMNLTDPYGLTELGTVRCHANCSGLYTEVNDDVPAILKNCVKMHEEDHKNWMENHYWPEACCDEKGSCVKEKTQATIPKRWEDWVECRGYMVEKECLLDLKSPTEWETIRTREYQVDQMKKRHCGAK